MPRKIRAKLILQLASQGLSQNAISRSHHISKRSVNEVLSLAAEAGITFEDVKGLSDDDEVYSRFYLRKVRNRGALPRVGLRLRPRGAQAHRRDFEAALQEHQQACQSAGNLACGYTKFWPRL